MGRVENPLAVLNVNPYFTFIRSHKHLKSNKPWRLGSSGKWRTRALSRHLGVHHSSHGHAQEGTHAPLSLCICLHCFYARLPNRPLQSSTAFPMSTRGSGDAERMRAVFCIITGVPDARA